MKLYGSLNNRFMENCAGPAVIKEGMGATEYCWSDRHAYEVVKVVDAKHLLVRQYEAERIDSNGMSESQEYKFTLPEYKEWVDEYGEKRNNNIKLVLTKKGWKERMSNGKLGCNLFGIGEADEYYDYSF